MSTGPRRWAAVIICALLLVGGIAYGVAEGYTPEEEAYIDTIYD